jgi:subtilisin family serine protease
VAPKKYLLNTFKGDQMTTGKIRCGDFTRMMTRIVLTAIIIVAVVLSGNPVYSACDSTSCITVGNDLSMKLCVEYQTLLYEFKLVYVPNSSALFWKMDPSTFKQIQSGSGSCIHIENDYAIKVCCAYVQLYKCSFTLNYTSYPADPTGLYWKLDPSTFVSTEGDPLTSFQWHIQNTGQTAFSKSAGTSGEDLRMTQAIGDQLSGLGVIMAVVDSGLEIAHEDIAGNVIANGSYNYVNNTNDPTPTSTDGDHGTSVTGIAAALSMNGKGGRGVAPRTSLKGFNAQKTDQEQDYIESLGGHPRSKDVDIFNMSYGVDGLSYYPLSPTYKELYDATANKLRGGKGAIYVKSAGNEFDDINTGSDKKPVWYTCSEHNGVKGLTCFNATAEETNSRPEVITVGAFNASGVKSSYSTAGSTLWISAPGGENGTDAPATITTDLSGKDKGYSRSDVDPVKYPFDAGNPTYNPNCNYTSTFHGTSSAAPNASGAIALILQTNPNLTRRDVKHILAKTTRKIDPDSKESYVKVNINGMDYQASEGWVANAAGYNFHNWYGFGAMNVDAAVAMARNYQANSLPEPLDKTFDSAMTSAIAIPDNDASGVTRTIEVSEDLTIENFFVQLLINHPDTSEVGIEITSPRGTRSILLNIRSSIKKGLNKAGGVLLGSNAFYGEKTKGTWTLKVLDSLPKNTGTLELFKLNIKGY